MATIVVSAAVIWREGRVLLTRRMEGAHLAGLWEFPGGKVEEGEDPEVALVRECREECGVEVVVEDILDVTFHRYATEEEAQDSPQASAALPGGVRAEGAGGPRTTTKDVLLLFYDCRLGEAHDGKDDPVQDLGVAAHVWCLPGEIRAYELPPPDERVIRKIEVRGGLPRP